MVSIEVGTVFHRARHCAERLCKFALRISGNYRYFHIHQTRAFTVPVHFLHQLICVHVFFTLLCTKSKLISETESNPRPWRLKRFALSVLRRPPASVCYAPDPAPLKATRPRRTISGGIVARTARGKIGIYHLLIESRTTAPNMENAETVMIVRNSGIRLYIGKLSAPAESPKTYSWP